MHLFLQLTDFFRSSTPVMKPYFMESGLKRYAGGFFILGQRFNWFCIGNKIPQSSPYKHAPDKGQKTHSTQPDSLEKSSWMSSFTGT